MKNQFTLFLFILLSAVVFTSTVSAQKLKPLLSGFNFYYELPALKHLPEDYKYYHVLVQSDINVASEDRILFLKDSVKRHHGMEKDRQVALEQALKMENLKLANQKLNEKLNPYYLLNKNKESDFAIELNVGSLQYEISEDPESDTIMTFQHEAEVHVIDLQTNEVFYSQSISEVTEKDVITKSAMIIFFTPDELFKLKFKKKNIELKKTIYRTAVERMNKNVLKNAMDSAASVLNYQLLPLRKSGFLLYSAKGKYNYDKLEKAQEILNEIRKARKDGEKTDNSRKEEISKFREAIAIWEEELTMEDRTDEKARINAVIGEALRYNIAFAYMVIHDFDKANEYVQQMNTKQPTVVSKPEHNLPKFASELKYLIKESELRLGDKL